MYNGIIIYIICYTSDGKIYKKYPILTFDKTSIIVAGTRKM